VFSNLRTGQGLPEIIAFIEQQGLLAAGATLPPAASGR
jgi:hypothetical protein